MRALYNSTERILKTQKVIHYFSSFTKALVPEGSNIILYFAKTKKYT